MSLTTITPRQLHELSQQGPTPELIDVRTPVEFREVHATFARNVPLDQLNPATLSTKPGATVYMICQGGGRSKQACEKLLAAGFQNVVNVEGGTRAWAQEGLPVVRGKKAISLERQVRIAAGSLVLTGAVLGYFVHHYWIGLSAFVGAGLIFAGVTDTCGMAIMLGKMPWNQVSSDSSNSTSCATPAHK